MKESALRSRLVRCAGWAALIASPFLLLLVISVFVGENAFAARPVWLDELLYWRSLYSWDAAGFDTGYYGMMEQAAPVGPFGVSGLGPMLIYGWIVKLFGLAPSTILLGNAFWIMLAAVVFCLLRKPRPAVSFALTALVMTYAPIVLYCTTSMTECFNYALMLLYLGFLLTYQEKRSPWALAAACCSVLFGCLYRPMYAVLFIPLVMFFSRSRLGWRMILSALIALGLSAAAWYVSHLSAAPNVQGFPYHLLNAPDLYTFVRMVLSHSKANLIDFFLRPTQEPMQDAFRWMYCIITGLCLLGTFVKLERKPRWRVLPSFRPPFLSCFLLLVAAFGLTIMLYEARDWRDYRLLAPFLWLVIAFFISRWRFTIPVFSLTACAATMILLLALPPVGAFSDEARFQPSEPDPAVTAAAEAIVFEEDAEDPFSNTIRTDLCTFQMMQEIHPGMGLHYGWFTTETTGESRWILTDRLKCAVTDYESVLEQDGWRLYRKIDPKENE